MGLCTGQSHPIPRPLFPDQSPPDRRPRQRPLTINNDPGPPRTHLPRVVDGLQRLRRRRGHVSRRVVRAPGGNIARGRTAGGGGRAVWIGEGRGGRERDRGAVGRVCDRVVFDAGDRAGDAGNHELRVVSVFSLSLSLSLSLFLGEKKHRLTANGFVFFLDYASVVFVGFAVISAVWYSISMWASRYIPFVLGVLTMLFLY
jgi:hypothetical protein